MMGANMILARVQAVKRTGPNKWVARCPAHDDRTPSLAIRELDDGRVLVHCFAGCSVEEVLGAVNMELSDLFPERPLLDGRRRARQPFTANDALICLDFEATLVLIAAQGLSTGQSLSSLDRDRLALAAERIHDAMAAVWTH